MSVQVISPSSSQVRNSQQSIANVSGSQNLTLVYSGIVAYIEKSSSFSSNTQRLLVADVTKNSDEFQRSSQIIINNEIDVQEWENSLDYNDETLNKIIEEFLNDFNIESNSNNIEWFKNAVNNIIDSYEKEYGVSLELETRRMLSNLITKMSYDKLCVKKLLN